jgi:hypothetical protein
MGTLRDRAAALVAVRQAIRAYREAVQAPLPRSPTGAAAHARAIEDAETRLLAAILEYGDIRP